MNDRIDHAKTALDGLLELEEAFAPVKERNDIDIRIVANLNGNAMRELAIAQVHSTLALVEQQRIANLMAYITLLGEHPGSEDTAQITAALGLT